MKYCVISNIGPHYRWAIYNLISKSFDCDFYFGKNERPIDNVKLFDYNSLQGYKGTLKNRYLFGPLWYQKGMTRLVFKKYDAFVISGAPFCLSTWFFLIFAILLRKKTIGWSHGILHNHSGLKRLIYKIYFSLFDRVMTYNERSAHLLEKEGVDKNKLYVIANSLNTDAHRELRSMLKTSCIYTEHFRNTNPVVLYCGRIQRLKKIDQLLDAVSLLNNKEFFVNVIIIGADSPDTDIRAMVKDRDLKEQVWVYGPCYNEEDLGNLFFNADVCVSPGNVGLTAIHSLSFGCPVITNNNFDTQMPEFEAIKPGITGDFYEEDDINALASKIQNWIQSHKDKKEATRVEAFAEIDRKWNIYHQVEIMKQVFVSIN